MLGGGGFSYGFGVFDFSHEEVKRQRWVCIYRFLSLHSSRCISLFVPRNKQRMIQKKKKEKETNQPRDRIFTQLSKYFSILKILQYDYYLLSLHTLLLYESLWCKNPETIVIVSTGRPNIGLLR